MIYYYRIILQYKGTRYLGWQIQPEAAGLTVQGELNKALAILSKSQDVKSLGSGRTDSGVHALGQVVKVGMQLEIPSEKLIRALNSHLPDDIRVIEAETSTEEFLPTNHAILKEYHYRFTCQRVGNPFQNELIANYPFELDFEKMQKACRALIGTHDFSNFYCEGTEVAHNIRQIFECELLEVKQGDLGMLPDHYLFRIVGNGFLKQMVRLLMGAVWHVGRGKISVDNLSSALSPVRVARLGPVAPPEGLYMVRVKY